MASVGAPVAPPVAQAQQPRPEAKTAGRMAIADGRITFVAPSGFTALTAEGLAAKYPSPGAPRRAVGNARRTTSIAYDLLDDRAASSDLDAFRRSLMETFAPLKNLKWVASDVRRVGSRDWAYVEFTAATADQEIHNIVLLSVYDGRILIFNFNSTVVEFPRVERALRASMATIRAVP
jgi:hypothetical protein